MEYLLRNNADPGVRDKQGYNAVHYSSAYGCTLCLELVRHSGILGSAVQRGVFFLFHHDTVNTLSLSLFLFVFFFTDGERDSTRCGERLFCVTRSLCWTAGGRRLMMIIGAIFLSFFVFPQNVLNLWKSCDLCFSLFLCVCVFFPS